MQYEAERQAVLTKAEPLSGGRHRHALRDEAGFWLRVRKWHILAYQVTMLQLDISGTGVEQGYGFTQE